MLLRVLERDVVLGQPRLPLPVLQQDEPDLRRRGRLNQGEEQEWVNERTVTMGWVFVTMAEDDVDASESGRTGEEMRRIFGFSVLFVSLSKYAKMLLGHMVCYLSSPSANVLGFWHTQRGTQTYGRELKKKQASLIKIADGQTHYTQEFSVRETRKSKGSFQNLSCFTCSKNIHVACAINLKIIP